METINIINGIADGIITLALIFFMYFVFREGGKISEIHYIERFVVRIALSMSASAGLYDFLTMSTRAAFLLHIGLALTFSWGAYFHYKYYIKK